MKNKICFLLDWYPTQTNNGCVFAKHLICAIADMGYECTVIAPRILHSNMFKKDNRVPFKRIEKTEKGNNIYIYAPIYIHFSSKKETMKLSMESHYQAVKWVINRYKLKPDAVYGHFIYQSGLTAARIGRELGIKSYCACGENSLRLEKGQQPYATGLEHCGWTKILKNLDGIVCVSSNNKNLLIDNEIVSSDTRMDVFPNGVNSKKFYVMNKREIRKKLGFPENAYIVAYVGALTKNKGADRLNNALKKNDDTFSIFLGEGPVNLDCENILFSGKVANERVPEYLNAADVFVLPTLGEGCSNAIIEALACGLPVISSNLPFNDDILSNNNSIRINVQDEDAIAEAIRTLKDNEILRKNLSEGAQYTGSALDICKRAEKILQFMEMI